ncbi:MAG: four-carbon acid sugar kinase family protein [Chitinophagaceae bacterium]|nr:four-carbon acid sugar kinase family protein [Chitinophagaceae bacterium]
MIAVIADDFTGAAELAGISLRYGLKVGISLNNEIDTDVDVLVVNTDSRSLKKKEALEATAGAIQRVLALKPGILYKKIDSVLRGYVLEELEIQLQLTGLNKVLVVPANPTLGRTVTNGHYFVDGKPIHESAFSTDPEFPVKSSEIKRMLNSDTMEVIKPSDPLPREGIVVGECTSENDCKAWADKIDNSWILAGAGDFYAALLGRKFRPQEQSGFQWEGPHLYVSGTSLRERKEFIREIDRKQHCVSYLPRIIDEDWLNETVDILRARQKLIIAIDDAGDTASVLRGRMAEAVTGILARVHVWEIFIEGGSTAAAILKEMKIEKLSPINELERGVVRMKANDLFITVKPGSYELPEEIERLYNP